MKHIEHIEHIKHMQVHSTQVDRSHIIPSHHRCAPSWLNLVTHSLVVVCNSVQLQQAQQQQVCWQLSECVQHCASVSASVPYQVHLPAEQVCTTQCKCTYVQLWQVCSPGANVASVLTSVLTRCNCSRSVASCQQVCSASVCPAEQVCVQCYSPQLYTFLYNSIQVQYRDKYKHYKQNLVPPALTHLIGL